MSELVEKVRRELSRYDHPLFDFAARAAGEGVEIEHAQFPWSFQKQLYDCLHDYVIEMFTLNPQRKDV